MEYFDAGGKHPRGPGEGRVGGLGEAEDEEGHEGGGGDRLGATGGRIVSGTETVCVDT